MYDETQEATHIENNIRLRIHEYEPTTPILIANVYHRGALPSVATDHCFSSADTIHTM